MPQSSKTIWIVVAVAVVLVLGGVWWYGQSGSGYNAPVSDQSQSGGDNQAAAPSGNPSASLQGSSDASIDGDLSTYDSQMKGLTSDSASVDQSLNDQPVAQSY